MRKRKERKPASGEERKPASAEERQAPGGKQIYIEAIGQWVSVKCTVIKSYYYAIPVPQDFEAGLTADLFDANIGDLEWTNFQMPERLPAGHEAMIFKVSLAVRPTAEVRIVDIFTVLQHGHITIQIGDTEFINEPLSFFPVTVYGEIAARENDLLQSLALVTAIPDVITDEERHKLMAALSGIAIPTWIAESQPITGCIDLGEGAYGTPGFDLFVVLHTITKMPMR